MVAAAMADEGRVAAVAAKGTVTPWSAHSGASAHSGTLKHFRDNVRTAGECVKQGPASPQRRCQGPGITAVAESRRAGSYYHHMAVASSKHNRTNCGKVSEEIVDFSIMRADACPMWKDNAKLDLLTRPPRGMPTATIPDKGPGRSEGPNT